eukprot:11703129-Alexandrium_andersonii.AAC.1
MHLVQQNLHSADRLPISKPNAHNDQCKCTQMQRLLATGRALPRVDRRLLPTDVQGPPDCDGAAAADRDDDVDGVNEE